MSMLVPDHHQRNRLVLRIILSVVGALVAGSFLVGIRW
jgi:hypothetical protein